MLLKASCRNSISPPPLICQEEQWYVSEQMKCRDRGKKSDFRRTPGYSREYVINNETRGPIVRAQNRENRVTSGAARGDQ